MENPEERTEEQKIADKAATDQLVKQMVEVVEEAMNGFVNVCEEHCSENQVPFIGINRLVEFKNHYLHTYRNSVTPPPVENIPDPKPLDAHDDLGNAKAPE